MKACMYGSGVNHHFGYQYDKGRAPFFVEAPKDTHYYGYRADSMIAVVPPTEAANHQTFWRNDETAAPLLVAGGAGAGAGSVAAAAVYSKAGTNGKRGTESKL